MSVVSASDARKYAAKQAVESIHQHIVQSTEGGRFSCVVTGYVPSEVRKVFVDAGYSVHKEGANGIRIRW